MRLIDAEELERLFNAQIEQGATDAFDAYDDALQDALTIDAVPVVHGRWDVVEGRRLDNAICSNCGRHFQAYYEAYRFCPNCGAKMDGGDDHAAD